MSNPDIRLAGIGPTLDEYTALRPEIQSLYVAASVLGAVGWEADIPELEEARDRLIGIIHRYEEPLTEYYEKQAERAARLT